MTANQAEAPWDQAFLARLGRALHERYRLRQAAGGNSGVPDWDQLPAALQASNLHQAAHLRAKLDAIGCRAEPAENPADFGFQFTGAEIAQLARMEHDRWVAERREAGWTLGPRDPARLTTPWLVPWEELSDEMRELDRMFVLAMPDILGDLGYRIVRGAAS